MFFIFVTGCLQQCYRDPTPPCDPAEGGQGHSALLLLRDRRQGGHQQLRRPLRVSVRLDTALVLTINDASYDIVNERVNRNLSKVLQKLSLQLYFTSTVRQTKVYIKYFRCLLKRIF
jgi:hypothetical protein